MGGVGGRVKGLRSGCWFDLFISHTLLLPFFFFFFWFCLCLLVE